MDVLGKHLDIIFIGEVHSNVLDEIPENSSFYRPVKNAVENQENRIIEIIRKNKPDMILVEGTEVLLDPRLKTAGSFYTKNLVSLFGRERVKFIEINRVILEYVDKAEKLVAYGAVPKEKRDPETERRIKTDYILANRKREEIMAEIIAGNLASGMTAVAIVGRNHVERGSLVTEELRKKGFRAGIVMLGNDIAREHDKFLQWKVKSLIEEEKSGLGEKNEPIETRKNSKGSSVKISNLVIDNNRAVSAISSKDAREQVKQGKIKAIENELSDPTLDQDERRILKNVLDSMKTGKRPDFKDFRNSLENQMNQEMINDAEPGEKRESVKKAIENMARGDSVNKGMENHPDYIKSMKISFNKNSQKTLRENKEKISGIYQLLQNIENAIEKDNYYVFERRDELGVANQKIIEAEKTCKITGDKNGLAEIDVLRKKLNEISKKITKNAIKKNAKPAENVSGEYNLKESKKESNEDVTERTSPKSAENPEETIRNYLSEHFALLSRRTDEYSVYLPKDNPIFRLIKGGKIDKNRAMDIFVEKQWEFIKNKVHEGRHYWVYVGKYANPMSGWKFHVYGNCTDDALNALHKIYSYLEVNFINYKIGTKKLFEEGGRQGKKAVVIYIPKLKDGIYKKLANDTKLLLGGYGKSGTIEGDAYMGGALNYRYEFTRKIGADERIFDYKDSEKNRLYRESDENYNIPGNPDPFEEFRITEDSKHANAHEGVNHIIEEADIEHVLNITRQGEQNEDFALDNPADISSFATVIDSARKLFLEQDISIIIGFMEERLPEEGGVRQQLINELRQEYSRFESEVQNVLENIEQLKRVQGNTADEINKRIAIRDAIINKIEVILSRYHDKNGR